MRRSPAAARLPIWRNAPDVLSMLLLARDEDGLRDERHRAARRAGHPSGGRSRDDCDGARMGIRAPPATSRCSSRLRAKLARRRRLLPRCRCEGNAEGSPQSCRDRSAWSGRSLSRSRIAARILTDRDRSVRSLQSTPPVQTAIRTRQRSRPERSLGDDAPTASPATSSPAGARRCLGGESRAPSKYASRHPSRRRACRIWPLSTAALRGACERESRSSRSGVCGLFKMRAPQSWLLQAPRGFGPHSLKR